MSRPAAAVHRVIKAYDVRGLVGDEIDEELRRRRRRRLRPADARRGRRAGGDRPRHAGQFAGAGRRLRRGRHRRRASTSCASGWPPPISCTSPPGCWTAPARCSPRATTRRPTTASSCAGPGAKPVGEDTGLAHDPRRADRRACPATTGRAGTDHRPDVLADYGEFLRSLVDMADLRPLRVAVDAGNGMAGHTAPGGPRRDRLDHVVAAVLRARRHVPQPRGQPAGPGQPGGPAEATCVDTGADIGLAFDGDADRCFVVDERGQPVSPSAVTGLVAARELSREIGATVIHNLITSRAVPELVIERGGTPVRSRVGHSYIKALMAETGAIFGGEHSAHYYFRDFWGADSGMLAALHVLAALGEQRPAAVGADRRLPALRSLRRDQLHRGRRAGVRGRRC